jgi:riboflavin kinase/FMN adenylyltransferase
MKLLHDPKNIPTEFAGAVVAIGNFDGVHLGHLTVLEKARAVAAEKSAPLAVLTFEPHPRLFLRPGLEHFCLTPLALKARLLGLAGVDAVIAARFDADLAGLSAHEFVAQYLVGRLKARHVVTGENFFFGKGREGDTAMLAKLCSEAGISAGTVATAGPDQGGAQQAYSSTAVRDALKAGDPEQAGHLLGHWWCLEGEIVEGDKRGRSIGFPTANMVLAGGMAPAFGVYVVRVRLIEPDGGFSPVIGGVANLGLRPTFALDNPVLESHLFDFDQDIYGHTMLVELIEYLRPERKFDGIDQLKAQIALDADSARSTLAGLTADGDPMAAYPIGAALAPA